MFSADSRFARLTRFRNWIENRVTKGVKPESVVRLTIKDLSVLFLESLLLSEGRDGVETVPTTRTTYDAPTRRDGS